MLPKRMLAVAERKGTGLSCQLPSTRYRAPHARNTKQEQLQLYVRIRTHVLFPSVRKHSVIENRSDVMPNLNIVNRCSTRRTFSELAAIIHNQNLFSVLAAYAFGSDKVGCITANINQHMARPYAERTVYDWLTCKSDAPWVVYLLLLNVAAQKDGANKNASRAVSPKLSS